MAHVVQPTGGVAALRSIVVQAATQSMAQAALPLRILQTRFLLTVAVAEPKAIPARARPLETVVQNMVGGK